MADSRFAQLASRAFTAAQAFVPASVSSRIRATIHRGERYACPLCGYRADGWDWAGYDFPVLRDRRVVGAGRRRSACYRCGSSDRERLVYVYLRDDLRLFADRSRHVLHIAAERELSLKCRQTGFARYVCGDLAGDGQAVQSVDVTALPYPDQSFDLVICNHVLEHVPDDGQAMRELRRVLKPAGVAILQVPISSADYETDEDPQLADPHERERRFGQSDHVRIYGQDYSERLTTAGFIVTRLRLAADYPECGLHPEEELFVCGA